MRMLLQISAAHPKPSSTHTPPAASNPLWPAGELCIFIAMQSNKMHELSLQR